jgi:DNA-binding transcriptional MerR regulator
VYTVGQFARICDVSAKTLRHYDAISLLRPAAVGPDNQYRFYTREQIPVMKRIRFLRELGLGLEVIREVMRSGALGDPDRLAAILQERAGSLLQEMAEQQRVLERLAAAVADLRETGGVPVMSEPAVIIKEVPAMNVVGVRRRIHLRAFSELMGEAAAKLRSRPAGPPLSLYHDPEFDPESVDVEVAFPVETGGEKVLPAVRVACATHVGPYDEVGRTYEALFAWLNSKGHTCTGPVREVYLVTLQDGKAPSEYVTEVQAPIG